MNGLWLLCRPGFEVEAGQEYQEWAMARGCYGFFEPARQQGLAWFQLAAPEQPLASASFGELVFTRHSLRGLATLAPLPGSDRVGAVEACLADQLTGRSWGGLEVLVAPGNTDASLARFARKWTAPLARRLRETGWLSPERREGEPQLELLLRDFERLEIGETCPAQRSPWPAGVPRLRLSRDAPSRSALKLEEAFLRLLTAEERQESLVAGMSAVDLGAAPGGWTWYLVRQHFFVTAVDNGPLRPDLLETGQVVHCRADGFAWLPDRPVDWLVCDIVDKPARTTDCMIRWLTDGHCRRAVFNLKLPMKKRLAAWQSCRERLEEALTLHRPELSLRAAQLYHDREEITVMVC